MKKFTSTDKWDDPWFFGLSRTHMLAWAFVNDRCDHAGVFDMAEPLIAAHLKDPDFTLEGFAEATGPDRFRQLPNGKWWLPKYIAFQHGRLSRRKKPHAPVFRSIEKNQLPVDVPAASDQEASLSISVAPSDKNSYSIAKRKLSDSSKGTDKDKDRDKGVGKGFEDRPSADLFEPSTDEIQSDPWQEFSRRTGLTRESMVAFMATQNSGAEAYTPDSLAEAYVKALAQRSMRVYDSSGNGRLVSPLNVRPDAEGFLNRCALKDPDGRGLVRKTKRAIDLSKAPDGWQALARSKGIPEMPWQSLDYITKTELIKELKALR